MLNAAFADIDITPDPGITKIHGMREITTDRVLDPLFARTAVFDNGETMIGFIQLDLLCIRWTQVNEIRERLHKSCGIDRTALMVSASHNQAGPAVTSIGECRRDADYLEFVTDTVVDGFVGTVENLQPARIGFGHGYNFDIAHNRRVVMRDGTVRTHGSFKDPDALYIEGPIDPEVGVLGVRDEQGRLLGCLINYACHPSHHGPDTSLSAGYPGALAAAMRERDCPVSLFLNGACGNLDSIDPITGDNPDMEDIATQLANDAEAVLNEMEFRSDAELNAVLATVDLPFRELTENEIQGTVRGAQRFVDAELYDRSIIRIQERVETQKVQPADVQALSINNVSIVGVPAEYFVEDGLRIKTETWPQHTLVASCTNGMVGYAPTRKAFDRGGYEATLGPSSWLAPEAGDLLTDAAVDIVQDQKS